MDYIKDLQQRTRILIDTLKQELSGLRSSRPATQIVEDIKVEYAGQILKVKQLGSISILPPREIQISAWDKSSVPAIAKAIENLPLGLNPSIDGATIRLRMPALSEERRDELVKLAKATTEKIRIRLRSLRDDANKKVEADFRNKAIGEDQKFKLKKQIQDVIDKFNKEIDTVVAGKIKELSE